MTIRSTFVFMDHLIHGAPAAPPPLLTFTGGLNTAQQDAGVANAAAASDLLVSGAALLGRRRWAPGPRRVGESAARSEVLGADVDKGRVEHHPVRDGVERHIVHHSSAKLD